MPTYEYKCNACGHRFEEFQSITAVPLDKCPKCEGKVVRLMSGGAGILFKGTGFYQTDYRSSDYKKKAAADTSSGSSGASSSSTASETKKDTTAPAKSST